MSKPCRNLGTNKSIMQSSTLKEFFGTLFFQKMGQPAYFCLFSVFFKQAKQFLLQINAKNIMFIQFTVLDSNPRPLDMSSLP